MGVGPLFLDLAPSDAFSAELEPEPGSRESALEWAQVFLDLAVTVDQEGFSYAAGRLIMASSQLREWAEE